MPFKNVILEIGTEEIPSRFIPGALKALKESAEKAFETGRIEAGEISVYATPRRLVLSVSNVSDTQRAIVELMKGPPMSSAYDSDGNPTRAAIGFAKGKGVAVEALKEMEVGGVRYLAAEVREESRNTLDVLPSLLCGLIEHLSFPKSMYWNASGVRFARPIRWIVALADDKVIPFSYAGVQSGRVTSGHRFMGKKHIEVRSAADFMTALYDNKVLLDQDQRRQKLQAGISALKKNFSGNLEVETDPELLEENLYLIEYPVPFIGSFDERYLDIPEEVLITSMKKNQKYFAVRNMDKKGALANYFVGVSNNAAADMSLIRDGNERVLRARLEDAAFFWNEDRKIPLASYVDKLKTVTYQEKLGSVHDKVMQTRKLAEWLCEKLGKNDIANLVDRAVYLSKADLVTSMVFEFTELQGVMGREYAKCSGEDPRVSKAIYEQYLPRFAGDATPSDDVGAIAGIAERIHIIAVCHKAGLEPSGTQDPYALRRAARCINEILWARGFDLDIMEAVEYACAINDVSEEMLAKIKTFIEQRLLVQLKERGYEHDLANLAISVIGRMPNQALNLLKSLNEVKDSEWFSGLVSSATRVRNILAKAKDASDNVDESIIKLDAERELYEAVERLRPLVGDALRENDWQGLMQTLSELAPSVASFFDSVMVMDEDPKVRANRIAILSRCSALFNEVGDIGSVKN